MNPIEALAPLCGHEAYNSALEILEQIEREVHGLQNPYVSASENAHEITMTYRREGDLLTIFARPDASRSSWVMVSPETGRFESSYMHDLWFKRLFEILDGVGE